MQRGIGQRGSVLPLVAISLAVLMGFAGTAVDVGFLEYRQQTQQSATDAAAMGGAEAAYKQGCQSNSVAQNAAISDATLNGFTTSSGNPLSTGSGSTVTAVADPTSGPYANNPCAVQVTISTPRVQTFFSRILGFNYMAETTAAVGLASQNNPGCIYLLSTSQASDMSHSNISAPGCDVYINDSANMSNATINAGGITYAGGAPNESGTTFTNATPAPGPQVSDPCPQMPGCAYLTNTPPTTSPCLAGATLGPNATITGPVCYSGLTLTGINNTVSGVITVNGTFHMNGATVTSGASGVTFYLTSAVSDTNFNSATLTLAPPTTGNTRNVVFYRDPAQSGTIDLSSCTCKLGGLLYFPTAKVDYSTGGGSYTVLVFGQGNFSNSSSFAIGSPPPNGTVGLKAVLAQ